LARERLCSYEKGVDPQIGQGHFERIRLFTRGFRQGFITVEEIERALSAGALTAMERWLFYYSLRAAEIEVRGQQPGATERRSAHGSGH
jgi:hypothetical protein